MKRNFFILFSSPYFNYFLFQGTGIKFYQKDVIDEPNMYWDVKDFNWLKKMKSPNFDTFSKDYSAPKPFESICIKSESSTLPTIQDMTTNIDYEDHAVPEYSSEDEL
jgi:hypothetical protein